MSTKKVLPVRVAVRIRPVVEREIAEGCQPCLEVTPGEPQIVLSGTEKAFTYDYVFDIKDTQRDIYETAVKNMLDNLFQGYNVTILAYGQTGSGKTYTMGTVFSQEEGTTDQTGVIPRAMTDLFAQISNRTDYEFIVRVSFLEIYKEQLYDLLSLNDRANSMVEIREDGRGIRVAGLSEVAVTTVTETMECLERGGLSRITGATAMNTRSSRSHAIFTVLLEQKMRASGQVTCAKLHLVDLAGSERAKKTQATGDRFKEGVNINRGLLSLGNVISALGEDKPPKHVPYRDSKLTRMLQESLGGNSHTLMIACTSPADSNLEETVSTLRYADRARKIKNKPIVNRDGRGELARLRQQVHELMEAQAGGVARVAGSPGPGSAVVQQNRRLIDENKRLMNDLQAAIEENTAMSEKAILAERAAEKLKQRLEELYHETGATMEQLNQSADRSAHVTLIRDLQGHILDIQNEQTRHEEEVKMVDVTRHVAVAAAPTGPTDEDEPEVEEELLKRHELRQVELNNELLDLNRALALKESLASEMVNNNVQLMNVRQRYEKTQRELEEQVLTLSEEKQRLEEALQGARAEASGVKQATEKRQRVLELEQRIKELRHKMKEQERLVRMKRMADEKVVQLNKEIQTIKQTRVQLIRQMRQDGDKYRQWRQQKDREVMKLRAQDRKRQVQLVKMERQHNKQELVLRRKMETAVAANRRLKEVLDVQRSVREQRKVAAGSGPISSSAAAAAAAVASQMDEELELLVSTQLAQRSLQQLIDDRRRLTSQLQKAEEALQCDYVGAEEVAKLTRTKRDLQRDLVVRNDQISDLQHRLLETERGSPATTRWCAVTSMADAKQALTHLFGQVVTSRTDLCAREADAVELQTQLDEALQELDELQREQARLRRQCEEDQNRLTLQHEQKVLTLLRHMPQPQQCSTPNSSFQQESDEAAGALQARLELQQQEIQRLSVLQDQLVDIHEQMAAVQAENERLRSQLAAASTQQKAKPAAAASRPRKMAKAPVKLEEIFSASESEEDDGKDPEWVRTPLFKRISKIKERASRVARAGGDGSEGEPELRCRTDTGVKRLSDGTVRCSCSSKCVRKCPCRLGEQKCGQSCTCRVDRCANRSGVADQTFTLAPSAADETFVVPPAAENVRKQRRRTLLPTPQTPDSPELFPGPTRDDIPAISEE